MGVHVNISLDKFPMQGAYLGKSVSVCFGYDCMHTIAGVCVRDDAEAPHLTIFKLADGRHVLATECQYRVIS
ncbi:hypothetical protein [Alishewanella sp. HL-SH06]|uniref:hypothetical protein n=1 Tax=Alishewanella sp. HL-SH06 TaxID=3461144 RepID=UPI004042AD20